MTRTLYRLPKKAKIAGVCAGVADYFDLDISLVRILFVVTALITGGGVVLLYIILAIILPVDHSDIKDSISEKAERLGRDIGDSKVVSRLRNYLGVGLLIFGAWLLLGQFWPQIFEIRWEFIWPVMLILAGLLIIIRKRK